MRSACLRLSTPPGIWSPSGDLNPEPAAYKAAALPIELHGLGISCRSRAILSEPYCSGRSFRPGGNSCANMAKSVPIVGTGRFQHPAPRHCLPGQPAPTPGFEPGFSGSKPDVVTAGPCGDGLCGWIRTSDLMSPSHALHQTELRTDIRVIAAVAVALVGECT